MRSHLILTNNARKREINQTADLAVGVVDSLTLSTIFVTFLTEVMQRFLEETGRFIFFPLAAAGALIRAGLAWRQAKLDNGKNGTFARAMVETVAALAISTAVIGGFVAAAIFATVSPIIFTATMAAKSLFHVGSAAYYWGKSAATLDPEKQKGYRNAARAHAVGAVASVLATVAVGLVMIAAKPLMAVFGITAGGIGAAFSFYNLYKSQKRRAVERNTEEKAVSPMSEGPSQSARLHQTFRPKPELEKTLQHSADVMAPSAVNNDRGFWERRPNNMKRSHSAPALTNNVGRRRPSL